MNDFTNLVTSHWGAAVFITETAFLGGLVGLSLAHGASALRNLCVVG
jgi:hypothetical protein